MSSLKIFIRFRNSGWEYLSKYCSSNNHLRNYTSGHVRKNKDTERPDTSSSLKKMEKMFDTKPAPFVDLSMSRGITVKHMKKETANSALVRQCLEEQPDKDGFVNAIDMYLNKNKIRRGHVDFISTAMKFIEPYGLQKEIDVYNRLIDVIPRNKFDNRSLFDAIWPKGHPQMFLVLDILTKMEWEGIVPSEQTHDIVFDIFGPSSLPIQKVYRMWFWFEEFKDLNPYKLPDEVYKDRIDVLKAAVDRILGNNNGTDIVELSLPTEENETIDYNHFILSSQTTLQQKYVKLCSVNKPLYVEGPIHIWMNHKKEEYFILKIGKGDLLSSKDAKVEPDEEREGVILAVCFATKPFEETLQKWLKHLQKTNPILADFNIVFDIADDERTLEEIRAISSS